MIHQVVLQWSPISTFQIKKQNNFNISFTLKMVNFLQKGRGATLAPPISQPLSYDLIFTKCIHFLYISPKIYPNIMIKQSIL